MKKLAVLMFVLFVLPFGAQAETYLDTSDYFNVEGQVVDSPGVVYNVADSVAITVTKNGHLCLARTWYNAGDAEADSLNGVLRWSDKIANIDADSGNGEYAVLAEFYDYSLGLWAKRTRYFYKLAGRTQKYSADSVYAALDLIQQYLDATISSRSTFNVGTDSAMIDGTSAAATGNWITGTGISSTAAVELAQHARDTIMETDTATLTTPGTFGEVNSGRSWFNPNTTPVVVDDTTKSGDSVATDIHVDTTLSRLDVILTRIMFHLKAAAFWPGSNFIYAKYATVDTLIIVDTVPTPDDTLLYVIRKHLSGTPGSVPDSGATMAGPGF